MSDAEHCLRTLAGDGSVEWLHQPIQASVLLEAADEIARLESDLERCAARWERELAEREARIAELDVENTRIKTLRDAWLEKHDKRLSEVMELKRENAELRELARDMWECFYEKPYMERSRERFKRRVAALGLGAE